MINILPAIAAFLAGFIKTTFGVGAGVFLTPILSIVMDPKTAVAIMAPMMLLSDISTLGLHWKKWVINSVSMLIPGCIIGIVLGTYYLAWASPIVIQRTIGTVAIIFSMLQILKQQKADYFSNLKMGSYYGVAISVIAGAASAIAHSGGIIITIYLVTLGLKKHTFVATLTLFLFISDIVKIFLYYKLGVLTTNILIDGVILAPALFIGSWLGSRLINKLTDKQFIIIINALIFISGLILVLK